MKRALFLIFFVFACETSASKQPSRDRVKPLISAYEGGPNEVGLSALEGDVSLTLREIAQDPEENRFHRARAFDALVLYPEPEVFTFLTEQLKDPKKLDIFLLPSAIRTLSEAFSDTHPEEVSALLTPLLALESPVLRESAARQLLRPLLLTTLSPKINKSVRDILDNASH
jgi:hypothetical protein